MDYSSLARSYNVLSYPNQLRDLVAAFFQTDKFNDLDKFDLAKIVSNSIFRHYEGEQILKYRLAKEFRRKNNIAAFEVQAKNSRADFLVINGYSRSFEVKSKVDTLNRLSKQADDYGDVFEYNTVVTDKIHLTRISKQLPDYYGIWYYEKAKKVIYRDASYSRKINPGAQLKLLNKKELTKAFCTANKEEILSCFSLEKINNALKGALKERYVERWNFVQRHWDKILPIDLQFFFNTNVKPEIVYGLKY